ncbi:polar amino acid transport system permease protein [Pseudomonas flavescens]|uniref:Glutamate/aspartate import permease protein GltK n=1 Tax=Phytopseudomonas flavescens TaxID=29435 RepID=A0A1G7ZMA5_9GAMM|nr:amino acid ABC transporter permease [Pseudomonas flavescens]SDH09794.1 polar amino acid transport system permease protein [Pseudomonas flavescens]
MSPRPDDDIAGLRIVRNRHWGRWFSALIVLLLLSLVATSMVNNPRFEWDVVAQNLTEESILKGVLMTIELTVISVVFGFAGGTLLALMRLSANPVLVAVSWGYTWFFRAVPMLVQLFLWYNIAALYPQLSLSLPFIGEVWSAATNEIISPFSAAVLALVIHQSAYAAEIIRAGIQSVGQGQLEAAKALGYRPGQIFRQTVLPQAMRTILPPAGNEVIGQLKTTAVVSVIALQDVLYSAQIIYQRTYEVIPLLLVATAWYLVMTSLLSVLQHYVEVWFSRGNGPARSSWLRRNKGTQESEA